MHTSADTGAHVVQLSCKSVTISLDDTRSVNFPCVNLSKDMTCHVQARGNIETWLSQVEQSMAVCLRKLARAGHQTYPSQARTQWVTQQPSQLVLLISQVHWVIQLVLHCIVRAQHHAA